MREPEGAHSARDIVGAAGRVAFGRALRGDVAVERGVDQR